MKNPFRKEARYVSRIYVQAHGTESLLDMMRYDSCYPSSEAEANKLARMLGGHDSPTDHIVCLTRVAVNQLPPTEGRWRSFGCIVLAVQHPDEVELSDDQLQKLAAYKRAGGT